MAHVKVSRGNSLIFESCVNSEGNITSLVSAIKTVQKVSNVFLSKLVEEEKSHNSMPNRMSVDEDEDENDNEDESDDDSITMRGGPPPFSHGIPKRQTFYQAGPCHLKRFRTDRYY